MKGPTSVQRRRIIAGAIAAPFVLLRRSSAAFDSRAPTDGDLTASVLANLPENLWSSDQIVTGNHVTDLKFGGNPGGGNIFAYSGGCYMSGQKKYALPGGGGHADSPNTGIAMLDFRSLQWSVTELSAIYRTNGVADPRNPCTNGESRYKSWPNANGQRAPMAGHRYSAPTWMPELGYGYSYGSYSYNSGTGCGGYYLFNSAGHHDQSKGFKSGAAGGTLSTYWLRRVRKLWYTNAGNSRAAHFDPLAGGASTIVTHRFDINDCYPDLYLQGPGVLIPDPHDAKDLAFVYWDAFGSASPSGERICCAPKVGSGAIGQVSYPIRFQNAVPPGLTRRVNNDHNSVWFDFTGNYKRGSKKILVWDWGSSSDSVHADRAGTGLYLLDTSSWRWSGPLPGSTQPFKGILGGSYGFKLIFIMSDYVVHGTYIPVGLIQPAPYLASTGQVFFYKIPWSAV